MNVSEKNARIWRKDYEGRNGAYSRYTVSIRNKNADGSYGASYYMPIRFSKKSGAPEKITNGASCDFEGFLTTDSYTNKEGKEIVNPQIIVMKVHFNGDAEEGGDSFTEMEEEIPF